jgi:hypothetical protein
MGIQKDLHLGPNDFTNGATAFFIGYAVAEIPQGQFITPHQLLTNNLLTLPRSLPTEV